MERIAQLLVVFIIAWALQACQSPKVKPEATLLDAPQAYSAEAVQTLLDEAANAEGRERMTLYLTAMEALVDHGDYDWARSLLEEFPTATLAQTPKQDPARGRWALLNSRLQAAAGNLGTALQYVSTNELMQVLDFYPAELSTDIRKQRARLLFDFGDYSAAINERIILTPALGRQPEAYTTNLDLLWQALMELPLEELDAKADLADTRAHEGWYRLAAISKNNQNNLNQQLTQVEQWQRRWPEHPAAMQLPADLRLLQELVANEPRNIAVLLPASGRLKSAGDAIRDGLLAAFYHYKTLEPSIPVLRFYDTEQGDINAVYDLALEEGAELIIGPLSKDKITALSQRLALPVPTLALNTVDNPLGIIDNLFQFGLGVEDDARQAANQAWRDGHRRVLIIAPQNPWGDRCVDSFSRQWQSLGGEFTQDYRFTTSSEFSNLIQTALHIKDSQERAKHMRRLVGSIGFEPRRRQDIDLIFMAAPVSQARQIKPMLAFHYASDIPVYATSQVYEGYSNPKADQDMNEVQFPALPWFFNKNLPEKTALKKNADTSPNLQPLYALGVDSFYLYPRLKQLQNVSGSQFYGQTGVLQLNEQGQVIRKQVWAEFDRGRARQIQSPEP